MKADIRALGQSKSRAHRDEQGEVTMEQETYTEPVDDRPRSVYEIVTRRMIEELKEDVGEVKGRVNTLLWLVAGAVLLEVVMRLMR